MISSLWWWFSSFWWWLGFYAIRTCPPLPELPPFLINW